MVMDMIALSDFPQCFAKPPVTLTLYKRELLNFSWDLWDMCPNVEVIFFIILSDRASDFWTGRLQVYVYTVRI